LPKSFDEFPNLYLEEDMLWLSNTLMYETVIKENKKLLADYNTIAKFIPTFSKRFSLKEYIWASLCVDSRIFNVKKCIIPYIDMINHSHEPDCEWEYSDQRKGFEVKAMKDLIPGE
jgi:hypothetical protein